MTDDRAMGVVSEIGRFNAFFPILPALGNRWAVARPWEGRRVALNLHLTSLTAGLVRELVLGGGTWTVAAANPKTTNAGVAEVLRGLGVEVLTGGGRKDPYKQLLTGKPDFLVDVGFEAVKRAASAGTKLVGAIEITRSGITQLRECDPLPFPVVNLNDGLLKNAVENRHGVGEAFWHATSLLTGMHLAGRRIAVIGYGPVGKGLAAYARAAGGSVEVIEKDPIRRLFAHYDGFPTPPLREALRRAGIVVTATGRAGALTLSDLSSAQDGVVLANAGHGGDEIEVSAIERSAVQKDELGPQLVTYKLETGPRVTLLGGGHPLNIVLNSGSPEPVLLHFALLGLTLEWLVGQDELPSGEVALPEALERHAAVLALEALGASPA